MVNVPGPYVVAGQLFFRLRDGSSVSCECIADVYAEKIVEACSVNAELLAALKDALKTIRALHGPIAWDIYEKNAPEMKRYHAAIAKASG